MMRLWIAASVIGVGIVGGGCLGKKEPPTLKPQAFYQAQNKSPNAATPVAQQASTPNPASSSADAAQAPANATDSALPVIAFDDFPEPAASHTAGDTTGTYMVVGTVVAEANGQPIYADKVLEKLHEALAARARRLEPREFRLTAASLINQQIMEDVTNELEFAAAERNLSEEDKQLATLLTMQFRQKEITKAGGSLAVARARAAAEGIDFDDKIAEEYRKNMILIFYHKKVYPKVQISADDMRRYYERHLDDLFTEKAEVLFRVIRIGFQETGGVQEAWDRIKRIHEKALAGEDFARLAATQNDNRLWARQRGYIDVQRDPAGNILKDDNGEPKGAWIQKGSLKLEELEKAVFALDVGQITHIIDGGDALYIAKLEDKKAGRVYPFEDEDVQKRIYNALDASQKAELRLKERKKLINASVTRTDEQAVEVAIEMAMQKYAIWNQQGANSQ